MPISVERVLEVVEHLRRGGRVVDRRRERADRDVDEDRGARTPGPGRSSARRRARPCAAGSARASACASPRRAPATSADPLETKTPTACGRTSTQSCSRAHATRPRSSIAWIAPGRPLRATNAGGRPASARISSSSACRCGDDADRGHACAATCARPSRRAPPRRPAAAGARRGRGRRGRARSPLARKKPHRVTPRFGTVSGFSTRRSSEYEKMNVADQHREHRLQDPVAVPEPHVARRERPGRHLHDEHADRDHEAGEPDRRADHRREHGERRARRVRHACRQVAVRAPPRWRRS